MKSHGGIKRTEEAEKGSFRKINEVIEKKRPSIHDNFEIRDLTDCFTE